MFILPEPVQFTWDRGNKTKNFLKHSVTEQECEEVFFDSQKRIFKDILHSNNEDRYILIGQTKTQRLLFLVFTLRQNHLRIISARDLNKKEYYLYEKTS